MTPSGSKSYRSISQRALLGALLLFDLAFFLIALTKSRSAVGAVVGVLIFGLTAVLLTRAFLASLDVEAERLTIRGPLRTTRLKMDEVEGFSLGRHKFFGCVCLVHRRGGREVPVFAIQGITGRPQRRATVWAEEAVQELNSRISVSNSAAPPG